MLSTHARRLSAAALMIAGVLSLSGCIVLRVPPQPHALKAAPLTSTPTSATQETATPAAEESNPLARPFDPYDPSFRLFDVCNAITEEEFNTMGLVRFPNDASFSEDIFSGCTFHHTASADNEIIGVSASTLSISDTDVRDHLLNLHAIPSIPGAYTFSNLEDSQGCNTALQTTHGTITVSYHTPGLYTQSYACTVTNTIFTKLYPYVQKYNR